MVSLAEQRFAGLAEKFLKDVFQQMGVRIFMMIGYQDQSGKMLRSKYVLVILAGETDQAYLSFSRLETPKAHPDAKTFTPIFNNVGGDTWDAFDKFLADCSGMSFFPLSFQPSLAKSPQLWMLQLQRRMWYQLTELFHGVLHPTQMDYRYFHPASSIHFQRSSRLYGPS
jgi:hypothetical protein